MSTSSRIQSALQKVTRREGVKAFVIAFVDAEGRTAVYAHAPDKEAESVQHLAGCYAAFEQAVDELQRSV